GTFLRIVSGDLANGRSLSPHDIVRLLSFWATGHHAVAPHPRGMPVYSISQQDPCLRQTEAAVPAPNRRPINESARMIEYGFLSHVGLRREHNEDTCYGDGELGLWLVADGMGGHEFGEVASALARDTIVR